MLVALVGIELVRGGREPGPTLPVVGSDLKGNRWNLEEHRGKRPVVVNFFATWCSPCRLEFTELVKLRSDYRNRGLELVVMSEEDAATLKEAGLHQAPFPVLADMAVAFRQFGVQGIPRTLYFSPDGKLAADLEGYNPEALRKIGAELEAMPVVASR